MNDNGTVTVCYNASNAVLYSSANVTVILFAASTRRSALTARPMHPL